MAEAADALRNLSLVRDLRPDDEKVVDDKVIDFVAQRLNNDWKQFAMQFLDDGIVQKIDLDNRTSYDKCHAMFREWKRDSPIPVTKGILKLRLETLPRRDIIYELSQAHLMTYVPPDGSQSHDRQLPIIGMDNEPLICHLKMKHIKRLEMKLDPSYGSGISNWYQLAHSVFDNDPKYKSKINDLELHYCGGGNPALKFLSSLAGEKPHLTVGAFQNLAQSLHRNDIYVYIEDNFSQSEKDGRLAVVPDLKRREIASKLNSNIPGINGWDMFADEYGYKYQTISNLKSTIKDEFSFSPTNKLFELLKQDKPSMSLRDLRSLCKELSRNDVAVILAEIIEEIQKN